MTNVVVGRTADVVISVGRGPNIDVDVGTTGKKGQPGPPGPEGGTPVVAVPYDEWPPTNPQPDTLYLRLAP